MGWGCWIKTKLSDLAFCEEAKALVSKTLVGHLIHHAMSEISAELDETHIRNRSFGPRFVSGVAVPLLAIDWAAALRGLVNTNER